MAASFELLMHLFGNKFEVSSTGLHSKFNQFYTSQYDGSKIVEAVGLQPL